MILKIGSKNTKTGPKNTKKGSEEESACQEDGGCEEEGNREEESSCEESGTCEKVCQEGISEKDIANAMAKAIFYRCELNDFQTDHFQKLNAPNPIFLKEFSDILIHFLWNWNDLLGKYKVAYRLNH